MGPGPPEKRWKKELFHLGAEELEGNHKVAKDKITEILIHFKRLSVSYRGS